MKTVNSRLAALLFSVFYVGLGTIWVLTSFGSDRYFIDWPFFIVITLPVTAISFAIRSGVESYLIPIIITQIGMLIITFKISCRLIFKFNKD
jgi:hypothetical protein